MLPAPSLPKHHATVRRECGPPLNVVVPFPFWGIVQGFRHGPVVETTGEAPSSEQ